MAGFVWMFGGAPGDCYFGFLKMRSMAHWRWRMKQQCSSYFDAYNDVFPELGRIPRYEYALQYRNAVRNFPSACTPVERKHTTYRNLRITLFPPHPGGAPRGKRHGTPTAGGEGLPPYHPPYGSHTMGRRRPRPARVTCKPTMPV